MYWGCRCVPTRHRLFCPPPVVFLVVARSTLCPIVRLVEASLPAISHFDDMMNERGNPAAVLALESLFAEIFLRRPAPLERVIEVLYPFVSAVAIVVSLCFFLLLCLFCGTSAAYSVGIPHQLPAFRTRLRQHFFRLLDSVLFSPRRRGTEVHHGRKKATRTNSNRFRRYLHFNFNSSSRKLQGKKRVIFPPARQAPHSQAVLHAFR